MTIDIERLKIDADYWDEVAPEKATHLYECVLTPSMWYKKGKFWSNYRKSWKKSRSLMRGELNLNQMLQRPTKPVEPKLMPDDCLAASIGEIGNQAHNLGCTYQNDEDLSERLGWIAGDLWDLAKKAPTQSATTEWDGIGLPPVGCECEIQTQSGDPWCVVKIVAHFYGAAVFAAGDDYPYGAYDGCRHAECFRPIHSQAELEIEELSTLVRARGSAEEVARHIIAAGWRRADK